MTTMAPLRTHDQRIAALEHANHIRTKRADLKRTLKNQPACRAARHAANLITDPPDWLATMRLDAFLLAVPYIGPEKTRRILTTVTPFGRARTIRVGGMTPAQRDRVAEWLTDHAERVN